jgi:dihydropteroate synthase
MRRLIGARTFDFSREVAVMAIIKRTPDSFFDNGSTFELGRAVDAALVAAADGADVVDVGGVPFGRGPAVGPTQELDRVLPLVEAIRAASDVVISVDTHRAEIARRCIEGEPVSSTIRAASTTRAWPRSLPTALQHSCSPIALHRRAASRRARSTTMSRQRSRRFFAIVSSAPSRPVFRAKDFIGETLNSDGDQRLEGSLAVAVICIIKGARIVRMHDVPAAVAAVRMTEAVLGFRKPAYLRHNMGDS